MADPYQAGATLGEALFGDRQATYQGELRKAAQGHDALEQARRSRALALIAETQNQQRSGITPELLGRALGGDVGAQAELGARTLGSNQTINLSQLGQFETPHFGEATNTRFDALGLGEEPQDIALANRATAFTQGEDYQPTRVLGGAYVPDAATLGGDEPFTVVPTPATAAQIDATQRRADAAVDRSNRAPAPRTKPPTAASDENAVLAEARAALAKGADKAKVQARLRERGYSKLAGRL